MKNDIDKDPYETLGVEKDADDDTIKDAYRKLAKKLHPDVNHADKDAEEKFKDINSAYEILSDQNKRRQYDQFGKTAHTGFNNYNDPMREHMQEMMNNFMNMRNRQNRSHQMLQKDIRAPLHINLKQAMAGGTATFTIKRFFACESCHGEGGVLTGEKCKTCGGSGMMAFRNGNMIINTTCNVCGGVGEKVEKCKSCNGEKGSNKIEKLEIKIPQFVTPMTALRIPQKGHEVFSGDNKIIGDLFVVIDYMPEQDGVYLREDGVHTSIHVPIHALIGEKKISVDVLGLKTAEFKLKSSNEDGHVYRINDLFKCESIIIPLFVKVFIEIPKKDITEQERKRLMKLMEKIYGEAKTTFLPSTD